VQHGRAHLDAEARPCAEAVSHDPLDTLRAPAKSSARSSWLPTMAPSDSTANGSDHLSAAIAPREAQWKEQKRSNAPGSCSESVQGTPNGISPSGWMPARAAAKSSTMSSSSGTRNSSRGVVMRRA